MASQPKEFFPEIPHVKFEGADTREPLAYRVYDKDKPVFERRMEDFLRPAVCWWHNFVWTGADVFGAETFDRAWRTPDPMEEAELRVDAAFEVFTKLDLPFFTFHDRDVSPEGANLGETHARFDRIAARIQERMDQTGRRLLWGTANLFSHPRYMSGAATNPDPEVFAYAASQVKKAMDVTLQLGGENYVLWGGREGYETLLNTDLNRELDQLGRFLSMVADYKHKIGFKGQLLLEPKPKEPTKHQYDFDTASVCAFLRRYGLQDEYRVNIEANHAILAGHTFHHEVAYAVSQGVFGSLDINRGDDLLGWDTDQFPTDTLEVALVILEIVRNGGFGSGGMNFDAKLRRQSIDMRDLFVAHIGGMDVLAQSLLLAEKIAEDRRISENLERRYAGWNGERGQWLLQDGRTLEDIASYVADAGLDPRPVSGGQELLEQALHDVRRGR